MPDEIIMGNIDPHQKSGLTVALARYIDYARWLSRTRYLPGTGWVLPYDGVTTYLENLCDFITTRELLVGDYYELLRDAATPGSVVWDIGMNIGAVSVQFAQMPNVARVYGYEPMAHTHACALKTIAANPGCADKVEAVNLGVGGRDYEIQVPYSSKVKSMIGLSEISRFHRVIYRVRDNDFTTQTLKLKDAATILRDIRAAHPKGDVLLKLDAEGAEYEILDSLNRAGLLPDISAAVIEWHGDPGPAGMLSQLQAAGFQTSNEDLYPKIGLIKAWRSSGSK
jgi:FkbM family methyltransferase